MLDEVTLICELDELWVYVGNNNNRHWFLYAFDTKRKQAIAYTLGPRNDETCRRLLNLLTPFLPGVITSNELGGYAREVPREIDLTGEIFTPRIERNNLTLRARIKHHQVLHHT